MNVLIVDDNRDFADTIADIVRTFGYDSYIIEEPEACLKYLERQSKNIGVMLLDIEFGPGAGMNGLDVLEQCRRNYPGLPIVMISGKGTIETAVRATKLGAINFIEKSVVNKDKIGDVVRSAFEKFSTIGEAREIQKFLQSHGIYGKSKILLEIGDSIIRFGRTDLNVLISGETGTGKKLAAKAIHAVSRRSKYPFVTVDIPNIPRELFQSELFGHNKGSFSGAVDTKKGLFHKANHGTLFLDEIGDLSLELQSNLFIPIEEKYVRKVGSIETEEIDVRFISATDKDLVHAMKESKFREQLYHRLRECEIYVPPLRERPEDIHEITEFYLQMHNMEYGETKYFAPGVIDYLQEQPWYGNVRELSSVIKVALQTGTSERVEVSEVHKILSKGFSTLKSQTISDEIISFERTLKEDLAIADKKKIETTLGKCNGNVSKAAAMLGISRETLHNKIRKYDINVVIFRQKRG